MHEETNKKVRMILAQIKQERESKGYSQEYVAYCLKIKQSTYQKIESGKLSLKLSYLLNILLVLELDHNKIVALLK
ncbi:helix-turn-helix domain-containing protein [Emticicia sp. CRIBPO]|uniref:helix-turn-helix domain-containing protein n=1 Tax=Emticicia sp. CRIBPO TaxID=2683258 RepID=UPI001411FE35|nr:helix-turn-helix domain-containing protein [Emticicia sp. CRIBPO]